MKLRKNVLQSISFLDEHLADSFSSTQMQLFRAVRSELAACRSLDGMGGHVRVPVGNAGAEWLAFSDSWARVHLPVELLKEYEALRQESLLGRIFVRANELHALVDRVVILAPHSVKLAIESIQGACCQPHWNELSRAARGSKPRLNLVSDRLDNDSIQGVLDLLGAHQEICLTDVEERWGLMIVCPDADSPLEDLFLRHFLPVLERQLASTPELLARCLVAMGAREGSLSRALSERKLPLQFGLEGFSEPSGMFSEGALLPAALLGVNVMEFVGGAAALSLEGLGRDGAFPGPAVDLAAANYAWYLGSPAGFSGNTSRILECYAESLAGCRRWYENQVDLNQQRILEEFVDIRTSSQLNAPRNNGPLVHQVVTRQWRFDELESAADRSQLEPAGQSAAKSVSGVKRRGAAAGSPDERRGSLPQWTRQLAERDWARCRSRGQPIVRTELPIVDELHSGYLMQWLLIALTLERELLGGRMEALDASPTSP